MAQEIERKFLVRGYFQTEVADSFHIRQGFLCSDPERTVRIRIIDNRAWLTVKGISSPNGMERTEHETPLDYDAACSMLKMAKHHIIEKTRYIIPAEQNLKWEVDVFEGENKGLVMAEIELPSRETTVTLPEWLGEEVTGCLDFYNVKLSEEPLSQKDKNFLKRYRLKHSIN